MTKTERIVQTVLENLVTAYEADPSTITHTNERTVRRHVTDLGSLLDDGYATRITNLVVDELKTLPIKRRLASARIAHHVYAARAVDLFASMVAGARHEADRERVRVLDAVHAGWGELPSGGADYEIAQRLMKLLDKLLLQLEVYYKPLRNTTLADILAHLDETWMMLATEMIMHVKDPDRIGTYERARASAASIVSTMRDMTRSYLEQEQDDRDLLEEGPEANGA